MSVFTLQTQSTTALWALVGTQSPVLSGTEDRVGPGGWLHTDVVCPPKDNLRACHLMTMMTMDICLNKAVEDSRLRPRVRFKDAETQTVIHHKDTNMFTLTLARIKSM